MEAVHAGSAGITGWNIAGTENDEMRLALLYTVEVISMVGRVMAFPTYERILRMTGRCVSHASVP